MQKEILELITQNQEKSKSELARMLAKKHPNRYKTVESARGAIRRVIENIELGKDKVSFSGASVKINARILVLDIEVAPLVSYHWRRWGQNIHADQTIHDNWPIITWSAKWLFDSKIISMKMTPEEAKTRDDLRLVKGLWSLIEETDIVIAHNGIKFDMRMINGRFLLHGLTPPSSYQIIDTLRATRKSIALPSYKLDDIAAYLGFEGKIKTDFTWWANFMNGDPAAIDKMQEYNDKDILVLEEVYLAIRPWIKPHPNLGLFVEDRSASCPACGSTHLSYIGNYTTYVNQYDEYRCGGCGHISRGRKTNTPIRITGQIKVSVPT